MVRHSVQLRPSPVVVEALRLALAAPVRQAAAVDEAQDAPQVLVVTSTDELDLEVLPVDGDALRLQLAELRDEVGHKLLDVFDLVVAQVEAAQQRVVDGAGPFFSSLASSPYRL